MTIDHSRIKVIQKAKDGPVMFVALDSKTPEPCDFDVQTVYPNLESEWITLTSGDEGMWVNPKLLRGVTVTTLGTSSPHVMQALAAQGQTKLDDGFITKFHFIDNKAAGVLELLPAAEVQKLIAHGIEMRIQGAFSVEMAAELAKTYGAFRPQGTVAITPILDSAKFN